MKILCVVRNYAPHAQEMKAAPSAEPYFFLKPDTALLADGQPLPYPAFSHDVQHEIELVVRIARPCYRCAPHDAHLYYDDVTLGIDFTARDLQRKAKEERMPWLLSKGFDGSAALGQFVPLSQLGNPIDNLDFALLRNGQTVQQGNSRDMIFPVGQLLSHLSQFITLAPGDLLFTGTPAGVGPVTPGDQLLGLLDGHPLLSLQIT